MALRDHFDALDFDLYDRWRVRLRDVPSTIGWGAVALFLRHLPYDSETMREMEPSTAWSTTDHLLARLIDTIGDLFAKDYEHLSRPGTSKPFETAEAVEPTDYVQVLERFRGGEQHG